MWTCPSCRRAVESAYCPGCGERARDPRELTLRGLLDQAFEALTNIDGKLLRSFRDLVARPGVLTVAFLEGRRKPYLSPVAIFLVANVLFFAVESATGGLVFSTPLASHMRTQPWSEPASAWISNRLAMRQLALAEYAPRFDAAIALHARSLILVMVIAFAPLAAIVFRRSRQPFAVHAVFSLHLYAFLLLLFSIGSALPAVGMLVGRPRSDSAALDAVLSIALLLACWGYLYVASTRVYAGTRTARLAHTAVLTVAGAAIVLAYRFALLVLTLLTTS